ISRVIRVTATNAAIFTTALAAQTGIALVSSAFFSDSFDSAMGPYQLSKSSTNGSLSCMSRVVYVASRIINGSVFLGPTAVLDGNTYAISGKTRNDLNADVPDATLPAMPMPFTLPGP